MTARELSCVPRLPTLYPRALLGAALPLVRRVPGLASLPGLPRPGRELPDLELLVEGVTVDRDRLAAYDHVCGFRVDDRLPPTYLHVLAFPLAMRLMTEPSFPFPAMGLVHVRNRIWQSRPLSAGEPFGLRVHAAGLARHERGTEFEIVAEVSAGGEVAWRERSTYLRRGGGGGSRRDRSAPPTPSALWRVPADAGRRYAAVSGDVNPIHMHPLTARLFGFPRAIAHGMWLNARCLAALESVLPSACAIDVRFKRPVLLPARVAFASWPEADGRAIAAHDARTGRPHLTGIVEPAAPADRS